MTDETKQPAAANDAQGYSGHAAEAATAPQEPPAQEGDPKDEVAKPAAQPVLHSVEEGREELDANPARTSAMTDKGHLVRE